MVTMRVRLERAVTCAQALQPNLPGWWPVADPGPDPVTGEPRPVLSEAERDTARRERALLEGCTGPLDGDQRTIEVTFTREGGPPRVWEPVRGYTYVLAPGQRYVHGGALRYRYAPAMSPAHRAAMAAVESAYTEAGAEYAARVVREGVAPGGP